MLDLNSFRSIKTKQEENVIDRKVAAKAREILLGEAKQPIPKEVLATLVPKKVFEIADDPTKIVIRQQGSWPKEISVFVFEKDSPREVTNPEIWEKWVDAVEASFAAQADKPWKQTPEAPEGVNPLHVQFRDKIFTGDLSVHDRILMACRLQFHAHNPQALLVVNFDGESHKGIGQDFYKNNLPAFAKSVGARFIVGDNFRRNVSFFRDTLKRYVLGDIKPEFKEFFSSGLNLEFFTIQFLFPEDVEKYVKKEAIK